MKTWNIVDDEEEFQVTVATSHNHSSTSPLTRTKHRANRICNIRESDDSSNSSTSKGFLYILDPKDDFAEKGKSYKEKKNISHEANIFCPPHVRQNHSKKKNITFKIKLSNASTKVDTQQFSPSKDGRIFQINKGQTPTKKAPPKLTKVELDNLRDPTTFLQILNSIFHYPTRLQRLPLPMALLYLTNFLNLG